MTNNIFPTSAALTQFGFSAVDINQDSLSQYKLPKQVRDEIPTINQFGYMKEEFDEFTFDFIEYASKSKSMVLELGTAYGWVVHHALKKGVKIIANDISQEHLIILLKSAPQEYLKNLYLLPAAFPNEIDFPAETLAAVLSSRMFHFLNGEAVASGLDKIHKWLKPDGKLFLISVTPQNYTLKKDFLPIYELRRKQGDPWPGIVNNMKEQAKEHAPYLNDFLHVFDKPQLEELLPKHGFRIDKIKLFDYGNNDSEGKGHIGFVATKIQKQIELK